MVAFARVAGTERVVAAVHRDLIRDGTADNDADRGTPGTAHDGVDVECGIEDRARVAAITTGRYSAAQPAMTALIATFSAVTARRTFFDRPDDIFCGEIGRARHCLDPLRRLRDDGKAVGPVTFEERLVDGRILDFERCGHDTPIR